MITPAKRWTAAEEARVRNTHSAEAIERWTLPVMIARTRQTDKNAMAKLNRRNSPINRNGTFKAIIP
jgi:hypothetical protein